MTIPQLEMSHSRNSSHESLASMSASSSTPASPHSPTHLILVQDVDDLPELELWQDGDSDEGYDPEQGLTDDVDRERGRSILDPSNPPLSTLKIIPLVISPIVKLGTTLLLLSSQERDTLPLPLPAAAIAVIVAGGLNSLSTQVHVLLGRYVKKWTIEGVVAEAFVGVESGGSRNRTDREPWKERIMLVTKAMVILGSSLLCAAYLRESTDLLVPLVPKTSYMFHRIGVTLLLATVVTPFMLPHNLDSRRLFYSNWLSIILYLVAGIVIITTRSGQDDGIKTIAGKNIELVKGARKLKLDIGTLEWLATVLVAFTTQQFTYPLFTSHTHFNALRSQPRSSRIPNRLSRSGLATPTTPDPRRGSSQSPTRRSNSRSRRNRHSRDQKHNAKGREARQRNFTRFLGTVMLSCMVGIVLVSLPLFIGVKNVETVDGPTQEPSPDASGGYAIPPILERIHPVHPVLAIGLLLGIPALWTGTITPRMKTTNVRWKWVMWVGIVSVASFSGVGVAKKVRDLAMIWCVGWGYVVPALLHITLHTLRPPLSIILPQDSSSTDDLLVRKERSLQKRRFGKRIWWDVGVWVFLAPAGILGWAWWAGRIIAFW